MWREEQGGIEKGYIVLKRKSQKKIERDREGEGNKGNRDKGGEQGKKGRGVKLC